MARDYIYITLSLVADPCSSVEFITSRHFLFYHGPRAQGNYKVASPLLPRVLAVAAIDACLYYLLSYELNTQQVNGSAPITSIIYIDPCHALDAVQKSNCYEFKHLVLLFRNQ